MLTAELSGSTPVVGAHVFLLIIPRNCAGGRATILAMNPLVLIIILVLLFGGGGFYLGGPAYGGGGLGLILLICLIVYLFGGFRGRK